VKVSLENTRLLDSDGTMQFLVNLPYLAILQLWYFTFDVEGLHLDFLPQAFPSLVALKMTRAQRCTDDGGEINVKSVQFKEGAAPKLEMLCFVDFGDGTINAGLFSGLASLPSLKKFELSNSSFEGKEAFVEDVRDQPRIQTGLACFDKMVIISLVPLEILQVLDLSIPSMQLHLSSWCASVNFPFLYSCTEPLMSLFVRTILNP